MPRWRAGGGRRATARRRGREGVVRRSRGRRKLIRWRRVEISADGRGGHGGRKGRGWSGGGRGRGLRYLPQRNRRLRLPFDVLRINSVLNHRIPLLLVHLLHLLLDHAPDPVKRVHSDVVVPPSDREKDVAPLAEYGKLLEPSSLDERNRLASLLPLLAVLLHREGTGEREREEIEAGGSSCTTEGGQSRSGDRR